MAAREQIWTALEAALASGLKPPKGVVNTVGRRLLAASQFSDAALPAVFILETDEERETPKGVAGIPQKLVMRAELWVYTYQPDTELPTTTPLNNVLDAIDEILLPLPGMGGTNLNVGNPTLQNLVTRIATGGAVKVTEGLSQGQAMAVIPLEITATI